MNDIGEKNKLIRFLYTTFFPVIGSFISGFLPGHSLLDPLFASAQFLPVLPGPLQTLLRVADFLHSFVTCFGQPFFKWFSLGRRN